MNSCSTKPLKKLSQWPPPDSPRGCFNWDIWYVSFMFWFKFDSLPETIVGSLLAFAKVGYHAEALALRKPISPEEVHYSGPHSGSDVPKVCPSQLFKVWPRGRVWYQRNADSLSYPPSHFLSHSAFPSLFSAFSSFTTCRKEQLARRCFKGLEPFQPLTTMAVQMQSCDLGNSSYPAPFQSTEEGDVAPGLCSHRRHLSVLH